MIYIRPWQIPRGLLLPLPGGGRFGFRFGFRYNNLKLPSSWRSSISTSPPNAQFLPVELDEYEMFSQTQSAGSSEPTSTSSATVTEAYASRYKRNLWGWYLYAFASEVFVIVSLALFLPICLEQYARDNGFVMPEKVVRCSSASSSSYPSSGFSSSYPSPIRGVLESEALSLSNGMNLGMGTDLGIEMAVGGGCAVKIGWIWVDTTSFSLYVYSISVALQAITVISMGGIADHPPHRKRIVLAFAALGSLSSILFFFLPSTTTTTTPSSSPSSSSWVWLLSAPLAMLANIGLGASIVAMNAYIPSLARRAPEVVVLLPPLRLRGFSGSPSLSVLMDSPRDSVGGGDGDETSDGRGCEHGQDANTLKNSEDNEMIGRGDLSSSSSQELDTMDMVPSSPTYPYSNANANASTPLLTSRTRTRTIMSSRPPGTSICRRSSKTMVSTPEKIAQGRQSPSQSQLEIEDNQKAYQAALSRTTARISSYGIAIGYAAGISVLGLILVVMRFVDSGGNTNAEDTGTGTRTSEALRMAIGASGVWWAVFTIPAGMWLPDSDYLETIEDRRSGRGDEVEASPKRGRRREREMDEKKWTQVTISKEIGDAWIRLGNMLRWREINKLRNTFKFLAAWFLLSDGLTTISSTMLLFSKTALQMSPSSLVILGLLTPISGILSSLLFPYIQREYGFSTKRILLLLGLMASFVPLYGVLGLFLGGSGPASSSEFGVLGGGAVISALGWGGLTAQWEMYVVAVYFGAVYAAFQGYARAFYAELLPPTDGARWYALFSIAGKSSSFIGPLIVGLISDTTGNIRFSFFALVCMIWAALPVLAAVDLERGRKDAVDYYYVDEEGDREDQVCESHPSEWERLETRRSRGCYEEIVGNLDLYEGRYRDGRGSRCGSGQGS